jgi:hypothetical protein
VLGLGLWFRQLVSCLIRELVFLLILRRIMDVADEFYCDAISVDLIPLPEE